jgi:hypothetical protein
MSMPKHLPITITDFPGHYRQPILSALEENPIIIGGPAIIVELDDPKFGDRKHPQGYRVEGVWTLGDVERTEER